MRRRNHGAESNVHRVVLWRLTGGLVRVITARNMKADERRPFRRKETVDEYEETTFPRALPIAGVSLRPVMRDQLPEAEARQAKHVPALAKKIRDRHALTKTPISLRLAHRADCTSKAHRGGEAGRLPEKSAVPNSVAAASPQESYGHSNR